MDGDTRRAQLLALQAQLHAALGQVAALLLATEEVGVAPGCPHPEHARIAGNFGQPIQCGICGETVQ